MTISSIEYLGQLDSVMETFRIKEKNKEYTNVLRCNFGKLRKLIASLL
jgi:hypothetical protein